MDTDQAYLDALDRFKKNDVVEFAFRLVKRRGLVELIHSDTTISVRSERGTLFRMGQDMLTKIA